MQVIVARKVGVDLDCARIRFDVGRFDFKQVGQTVDVKRRTALTHVRVAFVVDRRNGRDREVLVASHDVEVAELQ